MQLGATLLGEPGYGDDSTAGGGVFADLDQWIQTQLLPSLKSKDEKDFNNTAISKDYKLVSSNSAGAHHKPSEILKIDVTEGASMPYKITLSKSDSSPSDDTTATVEWQRPEFAQAYQSFWQSRMPLTAYSYHAADTTITRRDSNLSSTVVSSGNFPLISRMTENRRLTASEWEQDTRHIRLEIHASDQGEGMPTAPAIQGQHEEITAETLPYRAGDVLSVIPSNSVEEVERFLSVLPVALKDIADQPLRIHHCLDPSSTTITAAKGDGQRSLLDSFVSYPSWPEHCTLRGWLTYCADIHALPEREDLWALGHCCSLSTESGHAQRDKLIQLSDTKGSALYTDYILREKRNWVDVLYDFDSLRAPDSYLASLPVLWSLLSPLRPREFSIASSPSQEFRASQQIEKEDKKSGLANFGIDLCVAVVEGKTPLGRSYYGLCSDYLCRNRNVGDLVPCWIRPGSFHQLPTTISSSSKGVFLEHPVLYIGAGTGIAPLRGLILERHEHLFRNGASNLKGLNEKNNDLSPWEVDDILLFGCRRKGADYYYGDEWDDLRNQNRLSIMTAFSQDQWHKIYVQQVLKKEDPTGEHLTNLLMRGCVYIAGGAKMARSVKDEILELLTSYLGSSTTAKQVLAKAQRQGRYKVEAWS